jgi:hypothetical protein
VIVFFIISERPGLNLRVFSWWITCAGAELAVCGEGMRKFTCIYTSQYSRNSDEYDVVSPRGRLFMWGVSN